MKRIQSARNETWQHLVRLAQGKGVRGKSGASKQVLLEGLHLCQEWLRHRGQPVLAVFDEQRLEQHPPLQALQHALVDTPVLLCPSNLINKLSQVPAPQGVFFCVTIEPPVLPAELVGNSLWLDRVQDPGNVGTLLRTAAAVGIQQIFSSPGCADLWSAKVLRAAQGAHFALNLFEHMDLMGLRSRLSQPLLASSLTGADNLYTTRLPPVCAWVFGNEGQGVCPELLVQADQRIFIPQSAAVQSLNVAVAAGVCLFEQYRQHCL